MVVQRTESLLRQAPQEMHVIEPLGGAAQLRLVRAVADHEEVRLSKGPEEGEDVLEPLELLQPTDEEEVRAPVGPWLRARGIVCGRRVRQEVGKHLHRMGKAELVVLVPAELAHRDEGVHLLEVPLHAAAVPVRLWRPAVRERTA